MTYLSAAELEAEVASRLRALGVDHEWLNENGESMSPEDFRVLGVHLDCKGSEKYYGSGYLTYGDVVRDGKIDDTDPVWYVMNDFMVISYREMSAAYMSDNEEVACLKQFCSTPGIRITGLRSLEEWVESLPR